MSITDSCCAFTRRADSDTTSALWHSVTFYLTQMRVDILTSIWSRLQAVFDHQLFLSRYLGDTTPGALCTENFRSHDHRVY